MSFADNLREVRARIHVACAAVGHDPACVELLAVSKTFPADAVKDALRAGAHAFGENYVQEGVTKILALASERNTSATPVTWHFIGPLQSNKTREVAEHFDWMHSVDREKIAQRLSDQRPASLPPLQICLQVNVSGEASKSGVAPDAVAALAKAVTAMPRLRLRGLMAIPEPTDDERLQRERFRALATLFQTIRSQLSDQDQTAFDTLSMGMSGDLESAIAESLPNVTTMVRVGTALFGQRAAKA